MSILLLGVALGAGAAAAVDAATMNPDRLEADRHYYELVYAHRRSLDVGPLDVGLLGAGSLDIGGKFPVGTAAEAALGAPQAAADSPAKAGPYPKPACAGSD
jgi:hypothetical protein